MKYLLTLGITLLFLILGVAIGLFAEVELREIIQKLYITLTGGRISFIGKNIRLFATEYYCLTFGFWSGSLWLLNRNRTFKQTGLTLVLTTLTFFMMLVFLCYMDSNIKLVECTACDDGTRQLHVIHDISYDLIITISLVTSLVPSVWVKRKTRQNKT